MPFAIVGSAGNVILFVCTGVGFVVLAAYTVAFAAHCYLVAVQGTAAGVDAVEWPDEPVYDWILKVLWLGGLVGCWVAPLAVLGRATAAAVMPDAPRLYTLLCVGLGLWALFPVGLLSAMSSARWTPLSPKVAIALVRLAPATLGFYLLTAVVVAAVLGLLALGLTANTWLVLPLATTAAAAGLLVHARLVGRMARLLNELDRPAPKKSPPKDGAPRRKKRRRVRAVESHDPWAVPDAPEASPDLGETISVRDEAPAAEARPPRPSYVEEEADPYAVTATDADDEARQGAYRERTKLDEAKVAREVALRTRPEPEALRHPLTQGVWTFPFYQTSRRHAFGLGVWFLATGAVVRVLLMLWPF